MADIQYPYAYDENNNLVCIEDVTEADRFHEFRCPNCGAKMRPRLGKKNAHCFYHADAESCGAESYIHKVAKEIIVNKFNSGSFPIKRKMTLVCNSKCDHGDCYKEEMRNFDLACDYDLPPKVEETLVVDNTRFIPDVTFFSSDEKFKPICIEIFYKHSCSEKKLELCDNVIEIRVKQFSDLIRLKNAILSEEVNDESNPSTYQANFINFDTQINVNPEEFYSRHPYCVWTTFEIKAKEKDEAKQKRYEALEKSTWSRLYWFNSGKSHYEKILPSERFIHHKASIFELTMSHIGTHSDDWSYFLDRVMEIFPELRTCPRCENYRTSDYGTEWCDIRKNGSSRKGTYNPQKALTCGFYSNNFEYGPEVYLWRREWQDNYFVTYPARKEGDNK